MSDEELTLEQAEYRLSQVEKRLAVLEERYNLSPQALGEELEAAHQRLLSDQSLNSSGTHDPEWLLARSALESAGYALEGADVRTARRYVNDAYTYMDQLVARS